MKNKKLVIALVLVFVFLILVASLVYIFKDYIFYNGPERTVKSFLNSIANQNFDESSKYVWPPERDKILTSSRMLESVSNISDSKVKIKFVKIEFKTLKIDNNYAEVNAKGTLNYQFFDASKETPFDRNFKLIKENKVWYIKSLN